MARIFGIFRAGAMLLISISVIAGVLYPVLITGFAQLLFPHAANGSLVEKDGATVGSELLGQSFTQPQYFWGRPSATLPAYNASASAGSNLSPANPMLLAAVKQNVERLKKADPKNTAQIPVDLVTASASGLDPHISIVAAEYQVSRVARVRKMSEDDVRALVAEYSKDSFLGFIGRPVVNVLLLNMALDEQQPSAKP